MLTNMADTKVSLNGVRNGEVISVAIMVEALGKKALKGGYFIWPLSQQQILTRVNLHSDEYS